MKNKDFSKLMESIQEAGEIKAGRRKPSRIHKFDPVDIKLVRKKLRVSQTEFAMILGVSPRTLQNWEQGRRSPDGPAKALLTVASRNPKAVLEALYQV